MKLRDHSKNQSDQIKKDLHIATTGNEPFVNDNQTKPIGGKFKKQSLYNRTAHAHL